MIVEDLVAAYFTEVYPCNVFAFMRRHAFQQSVKLNAAPHGLLLAVCAMSARYVINDYEMYSSKWISEAKSESNDEIGRGTMTASTLGCLIICFHHHLYDRDYVAAWMTSGTATR